MGWFDDIPGFNPAEFQVSDEERKKLLLGNILLGISAGAFNSNKGNQIGALGSGLLQGAMLGQRALSDAQAAKLDKLKAAAGFMDFAEKKRNYMGEQAYNTAMGAFQPSNMPNLPSLAPTPENVAAARPLTEADRVQQRIRYLEENKAKMNIPQKYIDAEYARLEKLAPKYKGMETVMDPKTGQPVLLQTYENQAPTPLTQYQPKPDMVATDLGGKVVWNDKLRLQPGQSFDKTMDPAQIDASKRGWAGLNLDQQKFLYQQSQDAQKQDIGKWQYDAERGGLVNLLTGDFKPAMQGGAPIGAKGESKKAEAAQSAQSIIALAAPLIEQSTGSYAGNAWDKFAQVFGISTSGADANAQLKVLQARLMTEQPRMEGPQSDRDVQLYREAAGEIGDPNVPPSRKSAALKTISALNKKYMQRTGATGGWSATEIK